MSEIHLAMKVDDYQEIGNRHCQAGAYQDNGRLYATIHGYPVWGSRSNHKNR